MTNSERIIGYARRYEAWWVTTLWCAILIVDVVMLGAYWLRMRREEREKEVTP